MASKLLALLYASHFGSVAVEYVFLPYAFIARGLTVSQVGSLVAVRTVALIALQPSLAGATDRSGRPFQALRIVFAAQFAGALALLAVDGFAAILSVVLVQACFRAPLIPVIDASTVREVGIERYGQIRVWGSLGFGICAALLGTLSRSLSYDQTGEIALKAYAGITAASAVCAWLLRDPPTPSGEPRPSSRPRLGLAFAVFVAWNALHWAPIASYNALFSLHTKALGLDPSVPGYAMGVAIAGETVAFLGAPFLFRRGGSARWAVLAVAFSSLRWLICALTDRTGLLIGIQVLHFFGFGLWYAAAISRLAAFADLDRRASVQAIFSAGVLAAGGAVGSWGGGWLLERYGGGVLFQVSAGLDALSLLVAIATWRIWSGPLAASPDPKNSGNLDMNPREVGLGKDAAQGPKPPNETL
ncbi:MAG: MFS transporter [Myxococcota bacterium]